MPSEQNKMLFLVLKALFLFELFWLALDSVSGFFQHGGVTFFGQNLSAIVRIIFVFLVFVSIILSANKKYCFLLFVALFVSFFLLFVQLLFMDMSDFFYSFQTTLKILMPVFLIPVISLQIEMGVINKKRLYLLVAVNSAVLIVNLILGYYSIGFSNYGLSEDGDFRGGRGFFYAGNEVAGALLALLALNVLMFFNNRKVMLLVILFFFISALSLGSKASLGGLVVLFFLYLSSESRCFSVSFFVSISALFIFFYDKVVGVIDFAINRWVFFVDQFGFETFILGGYKRLSNAERILFEMTESPMSIFIGLGWSGNAENNFIDLLEGFGLFGVMIFFFWVSKPLRILSAYPDIERQRVRISAVSLFLIIGVAFFAGHILQSAMVSIFLALLACPSTIKLLASEDSAHKAVTL